MSDRYGKQRVFLGQEGQARIEKSSVLVAGLGALGGTIADLMVRAGVGRILLIDRDRVELGNLHRQILFDEQDAARNALKAEVAGIKLHAVNNQVKVDARVMDISNDNIDELISGVDIIFDALDNIATRMIVNDAAIRNNKPWMYCGVAGGRGSVFLIIPGVTPCLRCLYPFLRAEDDISWIDSTGVLGTTASFAATLAADEGLKYLSGNSGALANGMIQFDLWKNEFEVMPLKGPAKDCSCSGSS